MKVPDNSRREPKGLLLCLCPDMEYHYSSACTTTDSIYLAFAAFTHSSTVLIVFVVLIRYNIKGTTVTVVTEVVRRSI